MEHLHARAWGLGIVLLAVVVIFPSFAPAQAPLWRLADHVATRDQWTIYGRDELAGLLGLPVASGDFNGDGYDDVAFTGTRPDTDYLGGDTDTWIVLSNGLGGEIDLYNVDPIDLPMNVVRVARDTIARSFGSEVFSGDFNGDGIDDLVIGSQTSNGRAGAAYIIWGSQSLGGQTIALGQTPPPGLTVTTINGENAGHRLGIWVNSADPNGDGIDDLLVTADQSPGGTTAPALVNVGSGFVVYGKQGMGVGSLFGTAGENNIYALSATTAIAGLLTIHGIDASDHFGSTIIGAKLDGNSKDEILISAALNRSGALLGGTASAGADGPGEMRPNCGETYIIWDQDIGPVNATFDLRTASPAHLTTIIGPRSFEYTGEELSSADLDGDGRNEVIIGALSANLGRGGAWIIYNDGTLAGKTIDLADVNSSNGQINIGGDIIRTAEFRGAHAGDILGDTIRAADLNRDGYADLMIGVPNMNEGETYIFFGAAQRLPPQLELGIDPTLSSPTLAPFHPLRVIEMNPGDVPAYSMDFGDFNRDGFPDMLINGMQAQSRDPSPPAPFRPGNTYFVSGKALSLAAGAPLPAATDPGLWRKY